MFGPLGIPEILFIMALALLIFGPRRLPEIGRTIGKSLAEFRKASNDLKRTINAELIEDELRQSDPRRMVRDSLNETKKAINEIPGGPPAKTAGEKTGKTTEEASTESESSGGDDDPRVARGSLSDDAQEAIETTADQPEPSSSTSSTTPSSTKVTETGDRPARNAE